MIVEREWFHLESADLLRKSGREFERFLGQACPMQDGARHVKDCRRFADGQVSRRAFCASRERGLTSRNDGIKLAAPGTVSICFCRTFRSLPTLTNTALGINRSNELAPLSWRPFSIFLGQVGRYITRPI